MLEYKRSPELAPGGPLYAKWCIDRRFLLLDPSMNPVFVNHAAAEILLYPQKVGTQARSVSYADSRQAALDAILWLARACQRSSREKGLSVPGVRVKAIAAGNSQSSLAVFLERALRDQFRSWAEKFKLTTREREVLQCLSEGD